MYFAFYCEDVEDGNLEKRRSVRPAHLARAQELVEAGRMLLAGPLLGQEGEDVLETGVFGSLIIADFDSIDDARAWIAADPYVTAGVYARVTVQPFKKVLPE